MTREGDAWARRCTEATKRVDWHFTNADAGTNLRSLSQAFED